MEDLPQFRFLDLSQAAFGPHQGFYFAPLNEDGSFVKLHGPFNSRFSAFLAAVEFTTTIYLATEEQGN